MATSPLASNSVGTIDVNALVSQLMAIERQPINILNTQVSSTQTKISALGTINGLVSSLQTAVRSLNDKLAGYSATSSNSGSFSASAISTAVPGTYTLNVTKLAQSQSLVAAGQTSSNTAISNGVATTVTFDFGTISGGTLAAGVYSGATFTSNGTGTKSITIDSTNNTLQGIRDAINAAGIGVTATIVNDGSATPYRLTLTSNATGANTSVKITTAGGDGTINALLGYDPAGIQNLKQTIAAQNASLDVNGIAITSPSNIVTGAIQGVTLTLNNLTTPATLTVAHDTNAITTAAASVVDAYNALTSQLKSRSAYGNASTQPGVLAGDGTIRLMQDQLRNILMTGASGGTLTTLSQVGITSRPDGTLALDSGKLTSAIASNYSDVANLFSSATGYATRLNTWSTSALTPGGLIDTHTQSLNTAIKGYNDQISRLETRMAALQKQYTTQFSNLNMLLSSMNNTSTYLSQQFAKNSSGG